MLYGYYFLDIIDPEIAIIPCLWDVKLQLEFLVSWLSVKDSVFKPIHHWEKIEPFCCNWFVIKECQVDRVLISKTKSSEMFIIKMRTFWLNYTNISLSNHYHRITTPAEHRRECILHKTFSWNFKCMIDVFNMLHTWAQSIEANTTIINRFYTSSKTIVTTQNSYQKRVKDSGKKLYHEQAVTQTDHPSIHCCLQHPLSTALSGHWHHSKHPLLNQLHWVFQKFNQLSEPG